MLRVGAETLRYGTAARDEIFECSFSKSDQRKFRYFLRLLISQIKMSVGREIIFSWVELTMRFVYGD